jgi:bacillithiol biosynthesis cysteine-adding enzyme BshC
MRIERVEHPSPFGHPLNAILKAWKEPWLREHYAEKPDLEGLARAAGNRQQTLPRGPVVSILARENARLGNPRSARLCEDLARSDAVVVMAGQQPGLFGGTLLSFEKTAGAIAVARRLREKLGVPVVPMFWNQSEDHDLEEVNRFDVPRPDGVVRLRAPIEDVGRSLDAIAIDESVVAFARDAAVECGLEPSAAPDLLPVRGEKFPDWTSRILVRTFADEGVLVAEPSWFRGLVTPLVRRAITDAKALDAAFSRSTDALRARGIEPQVEARDRSMLFLVSPDGVRRRLLLRDDGWEEDKTGARFTEKDLLERLEMNPHEFSANVQLRAVIQQILLPVGVQVGGPAEVAYFAQFPDLFRVLGLPLPAMIVRPDSTVLGPKEAGLRESLGLSAADLLRGPASWEEPPDSGRLAELAEAMKTKHRELAERVRKEAGNDSLVRAAQSYEKALALADEKLLGTFRRDRERESGVSASRRGRLGDWVFPRGKPQNRCFGLLPVLARASLDAVRGFFRELDPLDPRHVICTFEEADR